jgi:tRNA threonylcarbamoyladenosine biosynthesis protein TsaB
MITLGIDTTAVAASVALVKDGKILSEFYTNVGLQHSRTLMPMIESMLSCCGIAPNQIDRFGVTVGPGSFTGVRIGVAAIKGMCFENNTPCVGISTLEALSHNLPQTKGILCPVMDARCNQVYNALFQWNNGVLERLCDDRAIAIDDLLKELKTYDQTVYWMGDGAHLCFEAIPDKANHILADEPFRYQRASHVALLAEQASETVTSETLAVSYLRPPQAVRARENKQ